ncbi:hypothetical protein [Niabella soli]|uniref:Beta-lactamase-inhibitor-like PepSY-like domain-containing protein n=1 Tax=Niabella soli DSM 19437 TaxID=929713 RepID=W0F063_9BACT|nr:hypothetical protein [Niabella soli]AHF16402.1 hypothetical protein NIASO_17000 [Niabella soli DSM 19437]
MKLFILTAALSLGLNAMAATSNPVINPTVNEKVLKTFHQVFADAKNVQWKATAEYNEASFNSGAIAARAIIDNNGKLVRTIRYYKETNLPSNILYKVKSKYEGKEVYGVTEITNDAGTAYEIVMRDSQKMYTVHIDANGALTQTGKFKRGDL